MKPSPQKIIDEAMKLEPTTRAFVVESLLESLDFEEDFSLSEEWTQEIRRRCEEIDSGKTALVDGETVLSNLHNKYPS
ncbi:MAG: addiction module protein [Nitrospira sp.]|nr:addiction module protein [Nitrospira sp.]MCB9711053.1 addiction module protein [Nitrospiraceae bacterium]